MRLEKSHISNNVSKLKKKLGPDLLEMYINVLVKKTDLIMRLKRLEKDTKEN